MKFSTFPNCSRLICEHVPFLLYPASRRQHAQGTEVKLAPKAVHEPSKRQWQTRDGANTMAMQMSSQRRRRYRSYANTTNIEAISSATTAISKACEHLRRYKGEATVNDGMVVMPTSQTTQKSRRLGNHTAGIAVKPISKAVQ